MGGEEMIDTQTIGEAFLAKAQAHKNWLGLQPRRVSLH